MTNVTIPQVEGGQTTSPTMAYTMELDSGSASVYSNLSDVLKLAIPEGYLINGYISPSVASNNLTLAVKTTAGSDPSATDPVLVRINGTVRTITAALAVTVAAGANSFNAGGSELATQTVDYFAYVAWRAASSAVVLGFSRLPYARVYSTFSATATSEKYGVFSTAPASTDDCTVIGRFAAVLSAGAGYTWSVPAYTSVNLVQRPIYETRWLGWTPVYTGYSADPTTSVASYKVVWDMVHISYRLTGNGTSNATTATLTMPFQALLSSPVIVWLGVTDNSALQSTPGHLGTTAGSVTFAAYKTFYQGTWTNSGTKGHNIPPFAYRIA